MRAEVNIAKGMNPEQAARAARLRFGNPAVFKERVGAEDALLGFDSLFRDVRYAMRGFARSAGFTTVAISRSRSASGPIQPSFNCSTPYVSAACLSKAPGAGRTAHYGRYRGLGISDSEYTYFTVPMWQEVRRHHDPFSGVFAWRLAE